MTFQSAPDCAEAVIHFDLSGHDIVNVLNFQFSTAYLQADLDNLSADVDNWVGTDYLPVVASAVVYQQTLVRGLTSIVDLTSVNATNTGAGTASGDCLPANASACITLRTGRTGRSARGRFYAVPTTTVNLATGESFVHSYMTYLQGIFANLVSAAGGHGWTFCVLSRFTGGARRTVAVTFPITATQARNDLIDSRRSRLLANH